MANLTANILCATHNSALSPLDSAARQALDTLAEAVRLSDVRARLKQRRLWSTARFDLDGRLLEHWFMKTVINLFHVVGREATWLLGGRTADDPPAELVEIAFGRKSAASPVGLYATPRVGAPLSPAGYFSFTPVFGAGERFAGAVFQFQGFAFLLWVWKEPPPNLDSIAVGKLVYHLRRIKFTVGGSSSHVLDLKW